MYGAEADGTPFYKAKLEGGLLPCNRLGGIRSQQIGERKVRSGAVNRHVWARKFAERFGKRGNTDL